MRTSMALVRRKAGALRLASSIAAAALPDRAVPNFALEALEPRRLLSGGFGNQGWTHADFPGYNDGWVSYLAVDSGGKIYAGGEVAGGGPDAMGIARFNSDGSPDTTFGINGSGTVAIPMTDDTVVDHILIEPDGKILVTGESTSGLTVVQLNSDGSIDTSFGGGPQVLTMFNGFVADSVSEEDAVWLTANGDLVVTAMNGPNVVTLHLTADGQPDTTFAPTGYVSSLLDTNGDPIQEDNLLGAVPTSDGGAIAYADLWSDYSTVQLVQFHLDDAGHVLSQKVVNTGLTPGSENSGDFTGDYTLLLNSDGSAFITSEAPDPRVAKLTPDGQLDPSFGNGGLATVPSQYAQVFAATPSGGAIVESGQYDTYNVGAADNIVRLNSDGSIDPTFNAAQMVGRTAYPALVLPDGTTVLSYESYDGNISYVLQEIPPTGPSSTGTSDAAALAVIANANSWSSTGTGDGLFAPVDGATIWNPDGTQSVFDDGGAAT